MKPATRQPQPEAQLRTTTTIASASFHKGPLPPAEVFEKYEQVLKGCADRIMEMAEKEQQHRHGLIDGQQTHTARLEHRGQLIASILGGIGLLGGLILVALDKNLGGLTTFIVTLGAFTGVHIYDRRAAIVLQSQKASTQTVSPPPE